MLQPVAVARLGRQPYARVWDLQRALQADLVAGRGRETLLLCEHEPVITLGRSASSGNILVPQAKLREGGVQIFEIERGGDVTYHGPGQIVAYPILDLRLRRRDVGWYMRSLEEVIIRALAAAGLPARRVPSKTGVWTADGARKLAAIGVRISRWCTMHGFSLNVRDCSRGFALINPCGFKDIQISSVSEELGRPAGMEELEEALISSFGAVFAAAQPQPLPPDRSGAEAPAAARSAPAPER